MQRLRNIGLQTSVTNISEKSATSRFFAMSTLPKFRQKIGKNSGVIGKKPEKIGKKSAGPEQGF